MSWADKLNVALEIITGDGEIYRPLWQDARKNINFNTDNFDFIDIDGTFVERGNMQGKQYPLVFYFQGENCIEETNDFETSSLDKRPWKITHPFYGKFVAQPLAIEIDNSNFNVSKISVTVWETLEIKYPKESVSRVSQITGIKTEIDILINTAYAIELSDVTSDSISLFQAMTQQIEKIFSKIKNVKNEIQRLKNLSRNVINSLNGIIENSSNFVKDLVNLLNFPSTLKNSIVSVFDNVIDTFNEITSLVLVENNDFETYQAVSTGLISMGCLSLIEGVSIEKQTRKDIFAMATKLQNLLNSHISNLDSKPDQIQNFDLLFKLDLIVNTTIASLFEVALNAKQERSTILVSDTNIVLLANKYFGRSDIDLTDFIETNEITLDEILEVKSGRKIIWYV
jgi:conjugal transfer/entry exclusion protein